MSDHKGRECEIDRCGDRANNEFIVFGECVVLLAMATIEAGIAAKTVLLSALRRMNQELTKKVGDGQKNFEAMKFDHLDEFLRVGCKVGIFTVLPVFSYVQCLKAVGANTRAELEKMWKECYHDKEVRECVEEFLSLEESLQELFDDIDIEVKKAEDQLAIQNVTKVGDQLPTDLALTNCHSGEVVHLENIWKQSKFTLFDSLKFYF